MVLISIQNILNMIKCFEIFTIFSESQNNCAGNLRKCLFGKINKTIKQRVAPGKTAFVSRQEERKNRESAVFLNSLNLIFSFSYDKKSDEGSNSVRMRHENSGASTVVEN